MTELMCRNVRIKILTRSIIIVAGLTFGCGALFVQGQSRFAMSSGKPHAAQPDLEIKQYVFSPGNDKVMKVHVANAGAAVSGLCILRLTVRKINGVAVGRVTDVKLPALAPGAGKWLVIDAKSILPNNVSLESTTFKLNADATSIVAESDENNNEAWHNL